MKCPECGKVFRGEGIKPTSGFLRRRCKDCLINLDKERIFKLMEEEQGRAHAQSEWDAGRRDCQCKYCKRYREMMETRFRG
jgi:hypothetical protein